MGLMTLLTGRNSRSLSPAAVYLGKALYYGVLAFGFGVLVAFVLHIVWKMARFDPDWMTSSVQETVEETVDRSVEETVEKTVEEQVQKTVDETVGETVEEKVGETVEEAVDRQAELLGGEMVERVDVDRHAVARDVVKRQLEVERALRGSPGLGQVAW